MSDMHSTYQSDDSTSDQFASIRQQLCKLRKTLHNVEVGDKLNAIINELYNL